MRAATMPEIEAAGLGALVRAQHGDDEFDLE
jgi:hypothetical protein